MTMTTSTQVTQMQPAFLDGKMVLGSVTVVVNFQEPQNYFGGQVVLTNTDDNISFTTTQDELQNLAIAKAKAMIASSELPTQSVPTQPEQTETTSPTETTETTAQSDAPTTQPQADTPTKPETTQP